VERYHELKSRVKTGLLQTAQHLEEIKSRALYQAEYETWESFCENELGFGVRSAQRLIQSAKTYTNLSEFAESKHDARVALPTSAAQVEPLNSLDIETAAEVWETAVEQHGNPTREQVREVKRAIAANPAPSPAPKVVKGLDAHVYAAAMQAMQGLDVAIGTGHCPLTPDVYSTREALDLDAWGGKVLIYARRFVDIVDKLLDNYECGNIEACVMVAVMDPYSPYLHRLKEFPFALITQHLNKGGQQLPDKHCVFSFGIEPGELERAFVANGLTYQVYTAHGLE
jgi:hypothetical protein